MWALLASFGGDIPRLLQGRPWLKPHLVLNNSRVLLAIFSPDVVFASWAGHTLRQIGRARCSGKSACIMAHHQQGSVVKIALSHSRSFCAIKCSTLSRKKGSTPASACVFVHPACAFLCLA